MATAHFTADQAAHEADTEFLVRRGMTKGYQWLSLLTPPAYVAFVLSQRGRAHLSVNRLLRATWIGGAAGIVGGGESTLAKNSGPMLSTLQVESSTSARRTQMSIMFAQEGLPLRTM
jgi:glutamate synthase domain-containing protein 1